MGMAVLVLLGSIFGFTDVARAGDPYGSTTEPSQPTFQPYIRLSINQGPEGVRVRVDSCGWNPAAAGTQGNITYDGTPILRVAIDETGCLVLVQTLPAAGQVAPATVGGSEIVFASAARYAAPFAAGEFVAKGAVGNHTVCAVVRGHPTPCATFEITAAAQSGGDGGTPLARTGITIALYLALAVVLILAGAQLLKLAQRRRNERAARARRSSQKRRSRSGSSSV